MRIRTLGPFEVDGVSFRDLGSRKGRTLLKMLALAAGHPVSVDRITDVLWGDDRPARPAEQVGVLVSRLRGVLGPERIRRSDAGYVLVVDWVDVNELRSLEAVAARALAEGRVGAARAAADAALGLARGELLADEDGDWILPDRTAVAASVTQVHRLRSTPRPRPVTTEQRRRWPRRRSPAIPTTRSSCGRSWPPTWPPAVRLRRSQPTDESGPAWPRTSACRPRRRPRPCTGEPSPPPTATR